MESNPDPIELLAPAGNLACLEAALEAGADAVYLGLTGLNARRHARNFSEGELAHACELMHAHGKRVHLTLNIDLCQDELARAARVLELASQLEVDAILVRDPALLALREHFPELPFHMSTQGCVASAADVEAARKLGFRRVVLGRELTLEEIAAASSVPGIETEVFVHGAMCFAVSGRCLLSSWVGGRSGNRGLCTGPCRVGWLHNGRPVGTPFSMHDLSLVACVNELRAAGVRSMKIEGRMKNPSWVRNVVALFRKAIDGRESPEKLWQEAKRRGATPGRALTDAYLAGQRTVLTENVVDDSEEEPSGTTVETADIRIREGAANLLREADASTRAPNRMEPDCVRLDAQQARDFLEEAQPKDGAIVEGLDAAHLRALCSAFPRVRMVAALPAVFYDDSVPGLEALLAAAAGHGVTVEVNTWGGWFLAQRVGVRMIAGPGLGVLNALAARQLHELGMEEVTASVESDALNLEALMSRISVPCSVVVFARPALMVTRADIPARFTEGEMRDRMGAKLRARRAAGVWEWRSSQPFDLRAMSLPPETAHAVVDLIHSPDALLEWKSSPTQSSHFNMDRVLS